MAARVMTATAWHALRARPPDVNCVLWGGLALVLSARLGWAASYFRLAGLKGFKLLTSSLYGELGD